MAELNEELKTENQSGNVDNADKKVELKSASPNHLHRAKHKINNRFEYYANKHGKPVDTIRNIFVGGTAAVLLVVVIIVLALTVFSSYHVSGDVRELSMYPTRTVSQITGTDGESGVAKSDSFNYGDPILVKLDLHTTGTEEKNYIYEVTDLDKRDESGNPTTVRKGSFPVSPTLTTTTNEDGSTESVADESAANTVRYISIVSSVRTALDAGNYELTFKTGDGDDAQLVGKMRFSVHGSAAVEEEPTDVTPSEPATPPASEDSQSSDPSSDDNSSDDSSDEQ